MRVCSVFPEILEYESSINFDSLIHVEQVTKYRVLMLICCRELTGAGRRGRPQKLATAHEALSGGLEKFWCS